MCIRDSAHAEDKGVDRADLEQSAGHGGSAGNGIIEAHRAEHAAQHLSLIHI